MPYESPVCVSMQEAEGSGDSSSCTWCICICICICIDICDECDHTCVACYGDNSPPKVADDR